MVKFVCLFLDVFQISCLKASQGSQSAWVNGVVPFHKLDFF